MWKLPVKYSKLSYKARKAVRNSYIELQKGKCWYCDAPLDGPPPEKITGLKIWWEYFPTGFLKNPIHLQHNHKTDETEGAVHAYCNAVLWQYEGR